MPSDIPEAIMTHLQDLAAREDIIRRVAASEVFITIEAESPTWVHRGPSMLRQAYDRITGRTGADLRSDDPLEDR